MNNLGVYLEIDSLFDTRMAMLYCINDKYAKELSGDVYDKRTTCDFGIIPYSTFNQVYKLRHKNLLNYAVQTNIKYIVKEILIEMYHSVLNIKNVNEREVIPTLYFNINPYTLNDEEKEEMYKLLNDIYNDEQNISTTKCNIEIIDFAIDEISPKWVKDNLCYVIMYNGLEWIEYHNAYGRFTNCPLYDITLVTADIIYNNYSKKSNTNILESTKEFLKTLINIEFIYVGNFNMLAKKSIR